MKKIISGILLIIGVGTSIIWLIYNTKHTGINFLDKEEVVAEVQEDIQSIENQEKAVLKWVPDAEIGHIVGEIEEKYSSPEGLVKYLFAALKVEDINMLIEIFDPESISQQLFKEENDNKEEAVNRWIQEMTREGKLENLGYKLKSAVFDTEANEMEIHFIYSDGVVAIVPVELKKLVHFHDDHKHSMVVVQTPIESILEEIKKH